MDTKTKQDLSYFIMQMLEASQRHNSDHETTTAGILTVLEDEVDKLVRKASYDAWIHRDREIGTTWQVGWDKSEVDEDGKEVEYFHVDRTHSTRQSALAHANRWGVDVRVQRINPFLEEDNDGEN